MKQDIKNVNKTNEFNFIKIPRDKWRYDLESGGLTDEESDVLFRLWLYANPKTGKVVVNYTILAEQMKGRFPYIKDVANKLTKIMNALKRKQRLWFLPHSGSPKPAEVWLAEYPRIQGGYTDISSCFQQSPSIGNVEKVYQDTQVSAELYDNQQRSEGGLEALDKLKEASPIGNVSRAPKIDREIKIEREKEDLHNTSSSNITKPLVDTLSKRLDEIASANPDREIKDPPG